MTAWTQKTAKLNSGYEIPTIGLGTWQSAPGEVEHAVEAALRAGYRHIDTAFAYDNEVEVGQGLKASGVPRSEIFLTSKLKPTYLHEVEKGISSSLKNLDVEYLDLFLIHWPVAVSPTDDKALVPDWTFIDTWKEMQKLPASGRVRSIGVSNFQITHLEKLLADPSTTIVPAVNQIELHPYNPSPKLVEYNRSKGIHVTGYSTLGGAGSGIHEDKVLAEVIKSSGKSSAQVMIKWGLQKGWSTIPKSVTASRIQANFDIDNWDLTEEEMAKIDSIKTRHKVCTDGWLPAKVFFGDDE